MHYELKISTNNFNNFSTIRFLLAPYLISSLRLLPKKCKRFVVIKSPHVNKKSKEHFQIYKYTNSYLVFLSVDKLKNFLQYAPNDLWVRIKKREVHYI